MRITPSYSESFTPHRYASDITSATANPATATNGNTHFLRSGRNKSSVSTTNARPVTMNSGSRRRKLLFMFGA